MLNETIMNCWLYGLLSCRKQKSRLFRFDTIPQWNTITLVDCVFLNECKIKSNATQWNLIIVSRVCTYLVYGPFLRFTCLYFILSMHGRLIDLHCDLYQQVFVHMSWVTIVEWGNWRGNDLLCRDKVTVIHKGNSWVFFLGTRFSLILSVRSWCSF